MRDDMRDYDDKMDDARKSMNMEHLFSNELKEKIDMLSEVSNLGWEIQEIYKYVKLIADSFLDDRASSYPHLGLLHIAEAQVSLKKDERDMWALLEKLYAEDKIISERQNEIELWKNYGYTRFDEFILEENDG
mgnify:CR=1 FL=1